MSQVEVASKLEPTIRGDAQTVDGVSVQIIATGPGVGWLERKLTERATTAGGVLANDPTDTESGGR